MNLSHNDPRFDDPDCATDRGGNTVPQHWRKHDGGCSCLGCMKAGINGFKKEEEADNA
jgi:hypothetical protein